MSKQVELAVSEEQTLAWEKFLNSYWPTWKDDDVLTSDLFLVRWNDLRSAFEAGWEARS
jgi:hypothetical protein